MTRPKAMAAMALALLAGMAEAQSAGQETLLRALDACFEVAQRGEVLESDFADWERRPEWDVEEGTDREWSVRGPGDVAFAFWQKEYGQTGCSRSPEMELASEDALEVYETFIADLEGREGIGVVREDEPDKERIMLAACTGDREGVSFRLFHKADRPAAIFVSRRRSFGDCEED